MNMSTRPLLCAMSALLLLASCGSSDGDATEDATRATTSDTAAADSVPAETATEETVTEEAPASAAAIVRVSGGPSETWELPAECAWTPENTSAASPVLSIEDTDDSGEPDVDIFEVWPVAIEDDTETSLLGFVTDPDGTRLVLLNTDTSSDGETITVIAEAHNGFKTYDDPPDFTLTITCGP